MAKIPVYDSREQLTKEADVVPVDVSLYGQKGRNFQETGKGFSALGEKIQEVQDVKQTAFALAEQERMKSDLELWKAQNPTADQKTVEARLKEYQDASNALVARIPSTKGKATAGLTAYKNANEIRTKWTIDNIKMQGSSAEAEYINYGQQLIEKAGRGEDITEDLKKRRELGDQLVKSGVFMPDVRAKDDIKYEGDLTDSAVGNMYSNMVLSGDASARYKFMKDLRTMKVNGKPLPDSIVQKYTTLASNAEAQDKINEAVEEGQAMQQAEATTLQTGAKKMGKIYRFEPQGGSPKFDAMLEEMNNAKDQKAVSGAVPTDPAVLKNLRLMMINQDIPEEKKRLAIVEETKNLKLSWKDWGKVESLLSMTDKDKKLTQEGLHYIEDWSVKNNFTNPVDVSRLQDDFLQAMTEKKDQSMDEVATGVVNNFLKRKYPSIANQKVMPNSLVQAQGGFKPFYQPLTGKRSKDASKPDATIPSKQDDQYEYKTVGGKTYRRKKVNA